MTPTKAMVVAARRAGFDYYQKGRKIGAERFVGTPDEVIKVMFEAALKLVEVVPAVAPSDEAAEPAQAVPAGMRRIGTTAKPRLCDRNRRWN